MEQYSKCELIGRGSPRYLNTLSNLFIVACITTYQCMVMIVNWTHVHHDATTKYHVLLLLLHSCRVSYNFLEDMLILHRQTQQQIF